jgi:hypothetical protein
MSVTSITLGLTLYILSNVHHESLTLRQGSFFAQHCFNMKQAHLGQLTESKNRFFMTTKADFFIDRAAVRLPINAPKKTQSKARVECSI